MIFTNEKPRELMTMISDKKLERRTISRRLVANGLHSCRPLRRLPLTPPNRRQRLERCRTRSTWMTEWHRVVFSDESRFCLSSDSRRVRVWRRRGERSNPAAIVERPTVRQRGIMVWGAISYDSRSPLLRIQGTMTAQRYVDDVLRPVTLPYLQGVPNALYQQDNARYKNIANLPLIDSENIYSPPLHIKLGLMKNFVKAMDRNASGFAYLKQKFSSISEAKIKEGIFVGPQIRELQQDGNFQNSLNEVEAAAWNSFRKVCKIFLGSVKVENYRDIVNDLLLSYKALGCNMSLKIHFLHSHLDFFPDNLGAVSDEHGERFHQDISSMEKRYQDQNLNSRNDRWICEDPSEVPVVMHTKFPDSLVLSGVKRLATGFHRRVKSKTSLQDNDVLIYDTTTKPQEKRRKAIRNGVRRLRWNP
ncbi:hypothetical protein LAZ67_9001700 [Cordylochernes scorpioides]|uniref:Transposase n=1 Tax=Cordylochernes scorpioides TaxID=51811 RepID=A0ABY6KWI3_9ARAC|nr:hypothetical protein LAZ67_9001700 [Cordylochernes scorpioides]